MTDAHLCQEVQVWWIGCLRPVVPITCTSQENASPQSGHVWAIYFET